ncbi:hypothetical protein JCM5296_007582 [Sporobolomyces johnsonii]
MDWARRPRARMTLSVSAGKAPRLSDIIEFVEATYKMCKLECKGPWFTLKIVVTEGMGQHHGKETTNRYSKGITDGIGPHACSHKSGQLSVLPVGSWSAQDYKDVYNRSQAFLIQNGGFLVNEQDIFTKFPVSDAEKAVWSQASRLWIARERQTKQVCSSPAFWPQF